jgi:aryl-alcohol dehydrogenase-like predicted oxidoreductase
MFLLTAMAETLITRQIPSTAERLPAIGLGTWQTFDVGPADYASRAAILRRFVARGGRLIDSSPMYGRAETVVGELAATSALHESVFVATKVWTRGRADGVAQMNASFEKLGVTRIDLMQVHNLVDVETHLETLGEWKAAGRIRYIGVTHYTVEAHPALEPFLHRGDIDFVQFNYSVATRAAEARLLPLAAEHRVATLINRPFESGTMFARIRNTPLPSWAAAIECRSWPQLFLKFVVSHPAVTCVIPATRDLNHLEDNMAAGRGTLPDADLRKKIAQVWDEA